MDAAEALFLGLAHSIFPEVVVDRMTIWDAAIVLPCIAGYTVFSYRVFRGKVREALYK